MDISTDQKQALAALAQKLGLDLLLLHGSQITGTTHSQSDLDIAFQAKKDRKVDPWDIQAQLYEVFHNDSIDLVDLRKANPLLLHEIGQKSIVLYGSEEDYEKFQLRAFHRYNDYQPYFQMEKDYVNQRLKV